jgi:glycosyltransferase involved in cell wall biosynthesis
VKLSVVIATRNRAASLARTLASLAEAHRPADWELVVDNGSSDDTPAVCQRFGGRLPLRRIAEPRVGLSHARNAGVREIRGDAILWTDDDVSVGRDWLVAYQAAFVADPAAAFFGGAVSARFEGTPPAWLVEAMPVFASSYAEREPAGAVIDAGTVELPFGANFAIRSDVQRRHVYDTALGRQPGRYLIGGEEIALMRRLLAAGGHGRWVPEATVIHWIGPERQTLAYLRAYWAGQGWVENRAAAERGEPRSLLDLLRTALRRELEWRAAQRGADRLAAARALLAASAARGALAQGCTRRWRR